MRVHTVPYAGALKGMDLSRWTVVVIDAVRASTTIAQALASGCHRVVPAASIAEARRRRKAYPPGEVLLGGERRGVKIKGFDLGNSPREYTRAAVRGKTVLFTTTNGTRAIRAAQGARRILIGAFVNMGAVTTYLTEMGQHVLLVPVGRAGAPVLDDVVCAGAYVELLMARKPALSPEAHVARFVFMGYRGILDALRESASGKALADAGLADDLYFCAKVSVLRVVPEVVGDEIYARRR